MYEVFKSKSPLLKFVQVFFIIWDFQVLAFFSFWDVGCSCPNITVCAKDRGGAWINGEHCDDREKNVLRAVVFLVKYLKTACQPQGLAGCFVKKNSNNFQFMLGPLEEK